MDCESGDSDGHVRLLDCSSAISGFGFDSGFYVRFCFIIKKRARPLNGASEQFNIALIDRGQNHFDENFPSSTFSRRVNFFIPCLLCPRFAVVPDDPRS